MIELFKSWAELTVSQNWWLFFIATSTLVILGAASLSISIAEFIVAIIDRYRFKKLMDNGFQVQSDDDLFEFVRVSPGQRNAIDAIMQRYGFNHDEEFAEHLIRLMAKQHVDLLNRADQGRLH